ncbi:hypothetical protein J6590_058419 [Homalodisca vitripennis]|nr:hypothetical protein J6590_058419 [Homalodisca vitripennis]
MKSKKKQPFHLKAYSFVKLIAKKQDEVDLQGISRRFSSSVNPHQQRERYGGSAALHTSCKAHILSKPSCDTHWRGRGACV